MADPSAIERLVGEDVAPFNDLLVHLSNPDATQRSQAETAFGALKERFPEALVVKLVTFVKNGHTSEVRVFAATLLRQVLIKDQPSLWTSVGKQLQENIKSELLNGIVGDGDRVVALKVADVVAELFSRILGSECWPELIPFLCQHIHHQQQGGSEKLVEICVYILAEIAPVLADSMDHSIDQFIAMMQQCLSNPDATVRIASIKAIKCFALALEDLKDVVRLKVLMSDVLVAFSAVRFGDVGSTEAYAIMIELAEYVPALFDDLTRQVLREFLSRARHPASDVNSKTMALEFLLAYIQGIPEEKYDAIKDCIADLMALLMDCLLQIEDVPDWHTRCGGAGMSPDFGDVHDLAIESVDRAASSIPGNVFLSLFAVYLQQWARDGDWKKRHAVLSAVGQMAEGCSAEIAESLMTLLEVCVQGLGDAHVRVRWAACQAIGLVADEAGSLIQKTHRDHLIVQLIQASVIDDPGAASVLQHALECLINIVQTSEHTLKGPLLDEIVKWILQSMSFAHESVNRAALDCLSCVTSVSTAPLFAKYYNECMKAVFGRINQIKDPNDLEHIASIVEVMTRVGEAAGKECFVNEYRLIIEYLTSLLEQSSKQGDDADKLAVSIHVLNSVARVCSIVTTDFDALDDFKHVILQALAAEPKLETVAVDDAEDEDDSEDFKIEIAGKCFRIEAMSLAFCTCGMKSATSIAQDLKHVFFPMLVPVLEAFMPAMDYKLIKDIRNLAIHAQPVFLECATERHRLEPSDDLRNFVATLVTKQWDSFMQKLGDMENETNETSASVVLEATAKTVEVLHGELEAEMMQRLFEKLHYILQHFVKLRRERSTVEDGELNDDEMEEFTEEVSREHELLIAVQKLFVAIFTHDGDRYFEQICTLLSSLQELMSILKNEESDYGSLETILTILTDICEYSQAGAKTYAADACDVFLKHLGHASHGVRHIAAFGIGIIAQKVPETFQPSTVAVVRKLAEVIEISRSSQSPGAEVDAGTGMAIDNAVSALGKVLATHGHQIGEEDQIIVSRLWLAQLPLRHDTAEAHLAHAQLTKAVAEQDVHVFGKNRENVMKIVEVLMEIVASDVALATPEDLNRIPTLLKRLEHENGCSQVAMQKIQKWTEEEKTQFHTIMNATQQ